MAHSVPRQGSCVQWQSSDRWHWHESPALRRIAHPMPRTRAASGHHQLLYDVIHHIQNGATQSLVLCHAKLLSLQADANARHCIFPEIGKIFGPFVRTHFATVVIQKMCWKKHLAVVQADTRCHFGQQMSTSDKQFVCDDVECDPPHCSSFPLCGATPFSDEDTFDCSTCFVPANRAMELQRKDGKCHDTRPPRDPPVMCDSAFAPHTSPPGFESPNDWAVPWHQTHTSSINWFGEMGRVSPFRLLVFVIKGAWSSAKANGCAGVTKPSMVQNGLSGTCSETGNAHQNNCANNVTIEAKKSAWKCVPGTLILLLIAGAHVHCLLFQHLWLRFMSSIAHRHQQNWQQKQSCVFLSMPVFKFCPIYTDSVDPGSLIFGDAPKTRKMIVIWKKEHLSETERSHLIPTLLLVKDASLFERQKTLIAREKKQKAACIVNGKGWHSCLWYALNMLPLGVEFRILWKTLLLLLVE